MLTAKAGQASKIIGLETRVDDYLNKPFDIIELNLKVSNLIEQRETSRKHFTSSLALRTKPKKSNTLDKVFYDKVYDIIEENIGNEQFSVELLANEMHISRVHLNRKVKSMTDLSTNKFIQSVRLKHAMVKLKEGKLNVSEVAFETGFSSVAYFVKCFREQNSVTPGSILQ